MIAEQALLGGDVTHLFVLVVDDDENVGQFFQRGFRVEGVSVVYFSSALKALQWVDQETPALAVVDVMMPDMNGVELCQALRKRDDTRELPIVLISAVEETELKKIASLVKAVAFVKKPFAPRHVFELMRWHLAQRQ